MPQDTLLLLVRVVHLFQATLSEIMGQILLQVDYFPLVLAVVAVVSTTLLVVQTARAVAQAVAAVLIMEQAELRHQGRVITVVQVTQTHMVAVVAVQDQQVVQQAPMAAPVVLVLRLQLPAHLLLAQAAVAAAWAMEPTVQAAQAVAEMGLIAVRITQTVMDLPILAQAVVVEPVAAALGILGTADQAL